MPSAYLDHQFAQLVVLRDAQVQVIEHIRSHRIPHIQTTEAAVNPGHLQIRHLLQDDIKVLQVVHARETEDDAFESSPGHVDREAFVEAQDVLTGDHHLRHAFLRGKGERGGGGGGVRGGGRGGGRGAGDQRVWITFELLFYHGTRCGFFFSSLLFLSRLLSSLLSPSPPPFTPSSPYLEREEPVGEDR